MKICFVSFNSTWIAILLIWNEVNTMCFVVAINLESLNYDKMLEVDASNHRHLICEMASIGNLFLVANVEGTVSIYNMPNWNEKVGVLAYNHTLFNMISLSSVTSTNIPIKNLLTLEKVEPKGKVKEGSFAVFTLTEWLYGYVSFINVCSRICSWGKVFLEIIESCWTKSFHKLPSKIFPDFFLEILEQNSKKLFYRSIFRDNFNLRI